MTLYVETTGDDATGDGTQAKPFRTVQKGMDTASPGDTVQCGIGLFTESINITTSGIDGSPISVRGTRGPNGEHQTVVEPTTSADDYGASWQPAPEVGKGVWKKYLVEFEPVWATCDDKLLQMITPENMALQDGSTNDGFVRLSNPRDFEEQSSHFGKPCKQWDSTQAMCGCYADWMYVRFRDDHDPNSNQIRVQEQLNPHVEGPLIYSHGDFKHWEICDLHLRGSRTAVMLRLGSEYFDVHDNLITSCGRGLYPYSDSGNNKFYCNKLDWSLWYDADEPRMIPGAWAHGKTYQEQMRNLSYSNGS
jgi:hypothetical protein